MLPTGEPTLSCVSSVAIECGDCGHSRWRKPEELYRLGFKPRTALQELGAKLYCAPCRSDGLAGKNIVMQAAFVTERAQRDAEVALLLRTQKVRAAG
jgi:DNA-directed RNA polymerase subunit N (RpoN/RPB10)